MSEHKASASLAEGARRFDRVIRDVKDGQIERTQKIAPQPAAAVPAFVTSPDEVWAKQYMTVGIGPAPDFKIPPQPQNDGEPLILQQEAPETVAPSLASSGGTFAPQLPGASGQDRLGAAIGHAAPKRSWLGRLFRGR